MNVNTGETTRILAATDLKEFFKELGRKGTFPETDSAEIPDDKEAVILEIGAKFRKKNKVVIKIWRWFCVKYKGKPIYAWKVLASNLKGKDIGASCEGWRGFLTLEEMHNTISEALGCDDDIKYNGD